MRSEKDRDGLGEETANCMLDAAGYAAPCSQPLASAAIVSQDFQHAFQQKRHLVIRVTMNSV